MPLTRSKAAMLAQMRRVLKTKKMSPDLRKAINATITALKKGDIALAADLSAVKSFIATRTKGEKWSTRQNHFYEYPSRGKSVYHHMDTIHHQLAFASGTMPSGLVEVSLTGVRSRAKPTRKHAIIKLMEQESAAIRRSVDLRIKRRKK